MNWVVLLPLCIEHTQSPLPGATKTRESPATERTFCGNSSIRPLGQDVNFPQTSQRSDFDASFLLDFTVP